MSAKSEAIRDKRLTQGVVKRFFFSQKTAPYLFILPFIVSFLLFFLTPAIQTIYMSFHRVITLDNMEFVGLRNFTRLANPNFFMALRTSTIYTIAVVLFLIPVPMLFAVLLNSKLVRGRNFFRSIIFIPALTSVIVAGVSFRLIFGELPNALLNSFLALFGVDPVRWVMSFWPGIIAMVTLAVWRMAGVYMVYFLSGLQTIPEELYESADIDGAGAMKKFLYITLPQMKNITIYVLTLVIFEGYRMFTESFVFWNEANPGGLGLTITRYIYNEAFQRNDMGLGSAIGITLLGIVLIINIFQLKVFGLFRKEES
ncbi:MAG: sugar ABC transporter permease [Oscillospiraceae bacterium]|nr:sugar ABC transporter permease [Oscillospiraceae bacterium]